MTDDTRPPVNDLYRAMPGGVSSDDGRTITVRLAPPDEWAEIDSAIEGHFLERFTRTAYRKTMAERPPKIIFQHGKDPAIGEKPIATTDDAGVDDAGPYARGRLLDGVPDLVVSGLREGVYGASHRFSVVREDWQPKPKPGPHNPKGLPERTISEARLYEMGPVTWPAYAGASVALRSTTDDYRQPAPSLGAAETHPEPERREEAPPIQTPEKETPLEPKYYTKDEYRSRIRELSELIERDAQVPGRLSDTAQEAFDKAVKERAELEADLAAWESREALVRKATEDTRKVETTYAPVAHIVKPTETDIYDIGSIDRTSRSVEDRNQKLRDNAMRAAETLRVTSPRYDQERSRERLADLLDSVDSPDKEIARRVLTTGSPQYREAFNRYVKSGGEERAAALAVGVDSTGGYSVPVQFDGTIVATGAWTAVNPYRNSCRVVTIAGTDTWQALTANAITAAYAAEAAAATEQGPTFTRPEFIAKRAHAFVTASYEMMQDRPDLAAELGVLFGEAKDTLEENQFTVGAGTTVYPQGIGLKDAFTRVDSVTNDTVAVADVLAVEAALPIRHRLNAAWYLTRKAIRAIQAWETTGGQLFNATVGYPAVGNPVNRPGGNTGLTLLGYPVWETPSMPWTPTTDDTTWGVLMDPRNYVIVDRVGMSVRVIPDMLDGATPSFPTGEVGIYAFWRGTARVLNVDGGRQGAVQ